MCVYVGVCDEGFRGFEPRDHSPPRLILSFFVFFFLLFLLVFNRDAEGARFAISVITGAPRVSRVMVNDFVVAYW